MVRPRAHTQACRISGSGALRCICRSQARRRATASRARASTGVLASSVGRTRTAELATMRSEEHTSELQSLMRNSYAVRRLKKKIKALLSLEYSKQHDTFKRK